MDNNTPVISAKNLNLWYGDFKALKSISLDVGEKEITALIGPSGCGKSTLCRMSASREMSGCGARMFSRRRCS